MKNLLLMALLVFTCYGQVKFAGVIIRHGARSPLQTVPLLSHRMKWPRGLGQLSPSGQRQLYLFGRELRKKYIEEEKLLPKVYNSSTLYARSTYYHRTAMSTQSLLFGLYPDSTSKLKENQLEKKEIWNPPMELHLPPYITKGLKDSGIPYDASSIPVRTFTAQNERLLTFSSCPVYNQFRKSFYNNSNSKFKEIYEKYKDTFLTACKEVNINCEDVAGSEVFNFVDYLIAAEFDGQAPELTAIKGMPEELLKFYTELMIGELTMDTIMQNIALHEFSKVFPALFENSTKDGYKMVVLGTHDSTILAYMLALKRKDELNNTIPYAANIIVELRKEGNDEFVKLIYNGVTIINELKEKFNKQIKEIGTIDNWNETCALRNLNDQINTSRIENNWFVICLGFFIVIGAIVVLVYNRKESYNAYTV